MHAAERSRAKVNAQKRTADSIGRVAISSASNERTSWLWARAALLELLARLELRPASILRFRGGSSGTRRAREAPIKHSAAPGQTRSALFEYLLFWGRLERPFRPSCDSKAGSNGRVWGELEQPFRAICGSGLDSSGQTQQITAFLERRAGRQAMAPKD